MKKILFKPEMIRAIIDGKKTQTRRIHKDMSKPRYNVGEVVYVGETYGFIWDTNKACYAADFAAHKPININWKSGRFMPEKYARIFLKITGVKKQRLEDVANDEAQEEGFSKLLYFAEYFKKISPKTISCSTEVWAYTFEVVKK